MCVLDSFSGKIIWIQQDVGIGIGPYYTADLITLWGWSRTVRVQCGKDEDDGGNGTFVKRPFGQSNWIHFANGRRSECDEKEPHPNSV